MKAYYLIFVLAFSLFACPKSSENLIGDYRSLIGLSIEAKSSIVLSKENIFKKNDVGKTIIVYGAGIGSDGSVGDELVTIIKSYKSSTKVIVADKAAISVQNVNGGVGTDNSETITPILEQIVSKNSIFELPQKGNFLFTKAIKLNGKSNLTINGNHVTVSFISSNPNSYIGGAEPKKNLFQLFQCSNILFKNFKAENIGQPEGRKNHNNESGFWITLNGKTIPYNRHFNKQANTGAFVQVKECQNIELLNIEAKNLGCLFSTIPGENFNANKGGSVKKCKVKGWGQTAVYPVHNMVVEGNIFSNEPAPLLSSDDLRNNLGTSHVIYSTSGYGGIKIKDNKISYCRGTAVQFNTKDKDACIKNLIEENTFFECARNGSFYGKSSPLEILLKNNNYKNCGRWELDQPNSMITFEKEQAIGEYSGNNEFKGFLSFSRTKKLNVKNCNFIGVVSKGNVGVIQMSSHSGASSGIINIEECYFDSTNNRAFLHLLDHNDFTGKLYLKKNKFDSEVRFVGLHGVPKKISKNGKDKFFIEDNIFGGSKSNQLITRFGVTLKRNKHLLKNKNYGIEIDMIDGAGESEIIDCEFINEGGENPILLTKATANDNSIKVEACRFKKTSSINKNGNKLKSTLRNTQE